METTSSGGSVSKPIKWAFYTLLAILGLFLLISLSVQIPFIQRAIVNKISSNMSRDLDTRVEVGHFYLNFFDDLSIEDVLVYDQTGDTLLSSQKVYLNVYRPLSIITQKKIRVEEVRLELAKINSKINAYGSTNYQFLIDYFKKDNTGVVDTMTVYKKEPSNYALTFNPAFFNLSDIELLHIDSTQGNRTLIKLFQGRINAKQISTSDPLELDYVTLIKPVFEIEKFEPVNRVDPKGLEEAIADNVSEPALDTLNNSTSTPLIINHFILTSGSFSVRNRLKQKPAVFSNVIDFANLNVKDVNIIVDDITFENKVGKGEIKNFQFKTKEGFVLERLKSDEVLINENEISFSEFFLQTPNSLLTNDLSLKFRSFEDLKDFSNQIILDAQLEDSYIALADILYFSNGLNKNEFFILNGGKRIDISGRIVGRINNFRGRNIALTLADKGSLKGNISLKNVMVPGEELLNLDVSNARFNMYSLRQLIPNFDPPENFNRLGNLTFSGKFDGFIQDFVAYGDLHTDLGTLRTDMRINVKEGEENAQYSGNIELIDFDLAQWSGNTNYGLASLKAQVNNGRGLSINNAYASLFAQLETFYYKGYNYQNANLEGELNKSSFDGILVIKDENVSLDFNGRLDFSDSIPRVDFNAAVEYINLTALNLSKEPLQISGNVDFDFAYHDLFNLDGHVLGNQLQIKKDTFEFYLDSLRINSSLNGGKYKSIYSNNDIFQINIQGDYNLENLPNTVYYLFQHKHPQFSKKLNFEKEIIIENIGNNDFTFELNIHDSKGLQKLFDKDLTDFKEISLIGYFRNNTTNEFSYKFDIDAPIVQFKDNEFIDIRINLEGKDQQSNWHIESDDIRLGNKIIHPFVFSGGLQSDSIRFQILSEDVLNIFSDVDFNGLFHLNQDHYQFDLNNSSFNFLNEPWQIIKDNYIKVGKKYIETQNLVFLSDDSYLRVTSPGDASLQVEAEKVDVAFLDDFINFNGFEYRGDAYANLHIKNIFSKAPVDLNITIDSFHINGDDFGQFTSSVSFPDLESYGDFDLSIINKNQAITAKGPFFIPITKNQKGKPLDFRFKIDLKDLPLKIGEYFIGDAISNTKGTLQGDLVLFNQNGKVSISGKTMLNGFTTIDYLGTTYFLVNQEADMSSNIFDLTGAIFLDEIGNRATATGGIVHNHFKKFGLNVKLQSDRFLFLQTNKIDNNLYYGTGIGSGTVDFTGNFKQTNIRANLSSESGTTLYIPLDDDYAGAGESFIEFMLDEDTIEENASGTVDLRGINMLMQFDINPNAEIQIIFDEFSGDIIKGTGFGNIEMSVQRTGSFQMFGNYQIENGQYLYTLLDIINKPFVIERGGTIKWNGDPLQADLNIEAKYTGLRTPPKNFIYEYLEIASGNVSQLADISTQVDLLLNLRGYLNQPEIGFEIQFPDIDPTLKNYTDNKMRILQDDESELNRQVGGLLILNTFLPPSVNFDLRATTVNTLSELITSQLSNYVGGYLTQAVEDVEYISGIDFYFDYNYYRTEDFIQGGQTGVKTGSEFSFAPNIRFFDDRLAFSPGASVLDGTAIQGSAFIGTDVKLDYFLTEDRRLKLTLFYKTFPSLEGRRNKLGLGIRYYKSYDRFGDIFRKQKKEESPPPPDTISITENRDPS